MKALTKTQQKRLDHAIAIAHKIQELMDQGALVYEEDGDKVDSIIVRTDSDGYTKISRKLSAGNFYVVFMHAHPDYDAGLEMTPKQYAALFKDWAFVYPKDVHKLGEIL